MKSPPKQVRDDVAGPALEAWIRGEGTGEHAAGVAEAAVEQ
jgi:hypothetical protein